MPITLKFLKIYKNWIINLGFMEEPIEIRDLGQSLHSGGKTEIVERKGLGHPDTICDHVAESVSVELCRYYLREYGSIMHHNVDKALLVGGKAFPAFNGGKMVKPVEIILAGRATSDKLKKHTLVEELASQAIRDYVRDNFRYLDPDTDLKVTTKVGSGSKDLTDLFLRFGEGEIPLANDTSYGVGFYPLSELEETVYRTERFLNSKEIKSSHGYIGEDIKIMGIRKGERFDITIAMAFIGRHVSGLQDYIDKKKAVLDLIRKQEWIGENYKVDINTADSYENGSIYLTVTGTSAEQGDDGEVGRGNRANGLITPFRPMTLEAVAGKNPVNHVGKLYNLFAVELSREIVRRTFAEEAVVNIVSQIGEPITEPQMLEIGLKGRTVRSSVVRDLAMVMLRKLPVQWEKVLRQEYVIS